MKWGLIPCAVVSVDSSPGPRYLVDPGITRFGRVRSLSYSMLGRGKRAGETRGHTAHPADQSAHSRCFIWDILFPV